MFKNTAIVGNLCSIYAIVLVVLNRAFEKNKKKIPIVRNNALENLTPLHKYASYVRYIHVV